MHTNIMNQHIGSFGKRCVIIPGVIINHSLNMFDYMTLANPLHYSHDYCTLTLLCGELVKNGLLSY